MNNKSNRNNIFLKMTSFSFFYIAWNLIGDLALFLIKSSIASFKLEDNYF